MRISVDFVFCKYVCSSASGLQRILRAVRFPQSSTHRKFLPQNLARNTLASYLQSLGTRLCSKRSEIDSTSKDGCERGARVRIIYYANSAVFIYVHKINAHQNTAKIRKQNYMYNHCHTSSNGTLVHCGHVH